MSDQSLPIPTGGDPAAPDVEVSPAVPQVVVKMWRTDETGKQVEVTGDNTAPAAQEPAPQGTPLDNVDTLIWHIDRQVMLADILSKYITRTFKAGVDFGSARGKADDKPTLLKPGGEKLITILGLRVKFVPDRSSLAMAGNPAGLFAYKCLLINWRGEIVGEGRGACSTGERSNMTINNAIKMAEKRAQGDAICRVACVSEHFTSDDDIPGAGSEQRQEQRQATNTSRPARDNTPNQPAAAPVEEPVNHKAYVWTWYKRNRQAQNQPIDNESVIGDINDLLRSYRMGATVNTATPAEWARAYNDIRKATQPAPAASAAPYEEIFN